MSLTSCFSVSRASPWLHGWDENSSRLRWLETNLLLQIGILCLHKDTLIIDVSLLPDAFETNSWATLSKTISGKPLPNWPEESWVVVCPGSISSSVCLTVGRMAQWIQLPSCKLKVMHSVCLTATCWNSFDQCTDSHTYPGIFLTGVCFDSSGKCTVGSEGWHRLCTVLIDWLMAISIKVFSLVCSLTRLDFESTMMGQ